MLITRIELENIKSYRRIVVNLRRGTTAISGENGSGKTTLVEAIGFALFGYLPYNHDQFVREGEKNGRVVVHLVGNDGRPYIVERRCGSVSRWSFYDEEADARLEQRTDVLDKLHALFGIDNERPLDSLFKDALGVPQGTFTAIFLEAASKRKQTFDALLQIEDYKTAADYLLEAQREYKDQMQGQQSKIDLLTFETRDLAAWQAELQEARLLDTQQKEQNIRWTQQLARDSERHSILVGQREQLNALRQRYEYSQKILADRQQRLSEQEQQVQAAQAAQRIVEESRADFERYQEAEEVLKRLRRDEQQRNSLRQQQAELENRLTAQQTKIAGWQERLEEVAAARQQVVELAPLVEQQIELERQRDEAMRQVERYKALLVEGKRLSQQRAAYLCDKEEVGRRIGEIEPLVPIAEQLHERNEILTQLRIRGSERSSKQKQLQEKQALLSERQLEREQLTEKLRKAERNVAAIDEHRREAEEMPGLQERYQQLDNQKSRLQGNIEAYMDSRAQSAGGQCPLLHESCLNIKQRGIASLESYFDNLLAEEQAQMAEVCKQQNAITERMGQIKKYAEALSKRDQYVERRDTLAEQARRNADEIAHLENDIAALAQDLAALTLVEQQIAAAERSYNESRQADARVRELAGLYKQAQQLEEQVQQCERDLNERRQEAASLQDSQAWLAGIEAALRELNDPRASSKTQQAIIAQESHFAQQLQAEQQRLRETEQRLQALQEQLRAYATLDDEIVQHEALRQQSRQGHQNYLQHEQVARLLPERERAYQAQLESVAEAGRSLREVEQAYHEAQAAFNAEELEALSAEIERLRGSLAALARDMKYQQEKINSLEQKIREAEKLLEELEAAQREYQELADLQTMMEQFRKLIKEAGPYVLKAMLSDISAEANRIFGEIMGDHSAQLSWQNDYEIILRRQGVNRTFAQLSGGEQMSAALAVRLALLKKLSALNIAFFDEPTQNMDELRRTNLAEQIRRVRGFDQLIVISHDDTFEQGLDSLVRLQKIDGETLLQSEDSAACEHELAPQAAVLW
ncbi:MAG TPA: SMC family ATPase [Ktedonobacteraceae bacterium]|nr:SMC family ATPase [Ktedonobacteraceae bacterium]